MLIYVNEFSGYDAHCVKEPEWARAERLEYCEGGEVLGHKDKSAFFRFIERIFG